MNAEERLQKIAELMRETDLNVASAAELHGKIMELLPPPPGLLHPSRADLHTVYRVKCADVECDAWRSDVETYPWLLSTGGLAYDSEVTIIGRADLPEGAPMELVTVEDYLSAPEGTIVLAYAPNTSAWQKFPDDRWYPSCAAERWGTSRGMTTFTRRVIRWGRGEHDK